jgi:aminopeptidase N
MRAFRDESGENLDWFFEQWVYMSGHPDLRVTKSWDEGRKLLTLTVEQTQKVTDQVPLFRLPLTVEFGNLRTVDGAPPEDRVAPGVAAYTGWSFDILVYKARQDFYFNLPAEPRMILFDK